MNKYSSEELELAIGQECILNYYGAKITGIIFQLKKSYKDTNDLVILKTNDQQRKEAFFISRIVHVPFLDKIKLTRLWKLLR